MVGRYVGVHGSPFVKRGRPSHPAGDCRRGRVELPFPQRQLARQAVGGRGANTASWGDGYSYRTNYRSDSIGQVGRGSRVRNPLGADGVAEGSAQHRRVVWLADGGVALREPGFGGRRHRGRADRVDRRTVGPRIVAVRRGEVGWVPARHCGRGGQDRDGCSGRRCDRPLAPYSSVDGWIADAGAMRQRDGWA